jgi:hypothetical protein
MTECRFCDEKMKLVFVWDNCDTHAYNVYACEKCGMLCKVDVWENKGKIWTTIKGSVIREAPK